MICAGMLVLGVFMVFNRNKKKTQSDEDNLVLTNVSRVTTMNLDINYPPTERDVVAKYGEIMQALYNETYEEKDLDIMADLLMKLYDPELLSNQTDYKAQLRQEVRQKKADGFTIQNYVTAEKRDVVYTKDALGREMAGLECLFSIRNATKIEATYYEFILRKDADGRWKIVGWTPVEHEGF